MKRLEILINLLDFGMFYPMRYIDTQTKAFILKSIRIFWTKVKTPQQMVKYDINMKKSQRFANDLQLFYLYNLLDFIVGASIAIMFLVITVNTTISNQLESLLTALNLQVDAFVVLLITSGVISYLPLLYFFYLHDKREKYFEKFDKEPASTKWKWSAISLVVYIAAWAVTFAIRFLLTR